MTTPALTCIEVRMARPTLVVAETEPLAALSTRKLVLETAKFNVLTAHSTAEALEILHISADLASGGIIAADLKGAESLVSEIKQLRPEMPLIYVSPHSTLIEGADYAVATHDPEGLVKLCRRLFGDPRSMETDQRNGG
ncbi:MAG: hypothetical protein ACRD3E_14570 [Terriglobales bacterium]